MDPLPSDVEKKPTLVGLKRTFLLSGSYCTLEMKEFGNYAFCLLKYSE